MINSISIVIPSHNEEENIYQLAKEITDALQGVDYEYEVLFINDGSVDKTWTKIIELSEKDKRIKGIDLAGNYGQTIALRAGFENAKGEVIVAMDGDLQHNPQYIPTFIELMDKEGYDMVGGSKANRPGSRVKKVLANFAHSIIKRISGVKMNYFGATFRAYRSYLLENINMLGDAHRFLGAIVAKNGIRHKEVPIEIRERTAGKSNYKLEKVFLVILDLIFLKFIISYMNKPFRLFGVMGGILFLIGLIFLIIIIIGSIFWGIHIKEDYMAEFLFFIALTLIGLFLISIGIIAEIGIYNYFSKNNQSPFIVRQKTGDQKNE